MKQATIDGLPKNESIYPNFQSWIDPSGLVERQSSLQTAWRNVESGYDTLHHEGYVHENAVWEMVIPSPCRIQGWGNPKKCLIILVLFPLFDLPKWE
jgi:hypothetical protein